LVILLTLNDEVMESIALNHELYKLNELKEIVYLESAGEFTKSHNSDGQSFLIENQLNYIEEILPNEKFFKINESFIINADYIKKIKVNTNKNVLLQDGIELNISQQKYHDLIKFLRIRYCIW